MEHKERIEKILAAHGEVQSFNGKALEAAVIAGKFLKEIKDDVGHGKFTPWLKENIKDISPETARRYMRLAKRAQKTDLTKCPSLRQAYLATGVIKAASPKKARTKGTATASTGTTASGATQTPAGATTFSPAVLTSSVSVRVADEPSLSELVGSVMSRLIGLTSDAEIKDAVAALAPCGRWYVQQSERLADIASLPIAA
jgi:hypothetical protein